MSRVLWTRKPMGATILSVALLVVVTGCSSVPPPPSYSSKFPAATAWMKRQFPPGSLISQGGQLFHAPHGRQALAWSLRRPVIIRVNGRTIHLPSHCLISVTVRLQDPRRIGPVYYQTLRTQSQLGAFHILVQNPHDG